MLLSYAGRYWRTLQYLGIGQILRLMHRRLVPLSAPGKIKTPVELRRTRAIPDLMKRDERCWLGGNRFTFIGGEHDFGAAVAWEAPGESRLWRYNLHYFDWLRQADIGDHGLGHMTSWIDANPVGHGTGWEPYPTSLRLVNWIGYIGATAPAGDVVQSLGTQCASLLNNLEFHLRANHLFVNIKALLFCGVMIDGALGRCCLQRGEALLTAELDEQFLADGGHFERSPMYHHSLTQDLLELAQLYDANPGLLDQGLGRELHQRARRALSFAAQVAPREDRVARFNDSVDGIAPTLTALRRYAAGGDADGSVASLPHEPGALTSSGYFALRDDCNIVVIDGGPIGPDYQPGHAHCNLLSFEWLHEGEEILVNCGNHDYEIGPVRTYCRSTRAHNTVVIDGAEQSEIWGCFRVGARAKPLYAAVSRDGDDAVFYGAHDGYQDDDGALIHKREVRLTPGSLLKVTDRVLGDGEHRAQAYFHFAPGWRLAYDGASFTATRSGARSVVVDIDGAVATHIEHLPRYPRFGVTEQAETLRIDAAGNLPLEFITRFSCAS